MLQDHQNTLLSTLPSSLTLSEESCSFPGTESSQQTQKRSLLGRLGVLGGLEQHISFLELQSFPGEVSMKKIGIFPP